MALEAGDILSGAGLAAAFVFLGVLVRQFVPWRKVRLDADMQLRSDLLERVTKLEKQLEQERIRHDAERRADRHQLNNVTTCFDALLLLIEMEPSRAKEAVQKVKEMRSAQMIAEAQERATIMAAQIRESAPIRDGDDE